MVDLFVCVSTQQRGKWGTTEQREGYDLIVRNMKTLFPCSIYDVNTICERAHSMSRKSGSFRLYPLTMCSCSRRHTHTRACLLYQPNPTCNIVTFFGRVYCVLSMAKRHYDARIQCLGPPSFGYFSTARRRHHLIEYYVIPILFFILLFFALFYAMLRKLLRSHRLSLLGIVLSLLVRAAALDMNLWFHV